ncbi:MAG: hypothetical protein H7Y18_00265 [Clostridiaceae bacterium]|nr:hypothetical protein [Clostridiaceae bacterium]
MMGRAVGEIALLLIGTKGVDKAIDVLKVSSESGYLAKLLTTIKAGDKVNSVVIALGRVSEAALEITNKLLTRFDEIFDRVAETVDKGTQILFKMLDGTVGPIEKSALKEQGVLASAIEYCLTGCFTGEVLVSTNKGLVRIDEIHVGDFVSSVKKELIEHPERIYNLSIEGYSTYYVSGLSLLVHNVGCAEIAELMKSVASKFGKFTVAELENLTTLLKTNNNLSRNMIQELMKGADDGKFILDKISDGSNACYKIKMVDTGTIVHLDNSGKVVRMEYKVGRNGVRGSGYSRAKVPAGTEKGHIKSVFEGAQYNCIEDSPLNIIAQSPVVNDPNIKAFEKFRGDMCQNMDVITDILDNGNVRVRVPEAKIDVTYNPLSNNTWGENWFLRDDVSLWQ